MIKNDGISGGYKNNVNNSLINQEWFINDFVKLTMGLVLVLIESK